MRQQRVVIRVLATEDYTVVREDIKQLIGMVKDLQVVGEATSGEQLLETLRGTPCEVVLLGTSALGINDPGVVPRVRALNEPLAILVLLMHGEVQIAARALKIGAASYATKDSDPALLLTAIHRVAGGGHYIGPDLVDRTIFEVGLTNSCLPHALPPEHEFSMSGWLVQSANVNEIAQRLVVGNKTISIHKARLTQGLNMYSVADLVHYVTECRLL